MEERFKYVALLLHRTNSRDRDLQLAADGFDVSVEVLGVLPAFSAEPTCLGASKGAAQVTNQPAVDPHIPSI
jgi:hypothetical protein